MAYSHYLLTFDELAVWPPVQGYQHRGLQGGLTATMKLASNFGAVNIAVLPNKTRIIMHPGNVADAFFFFFLKIIYLSCIFGIVIS